MSDYVKAVFDIKPYSADAADLLAAFLADAGFDSFEESDGSLVAYCDAKLFSRGAVEEAVAALPMDARVSWESTLIPHQDWNEEWEKNYFKPLVLADGRCVVHSTFHSDFPQATYEIVIDPKMAFGTGHHATTSMMVNHLFGLDLGGKTVLDMGTGTGILAILADMLGAEKVTGIEIDADAIENTRENVALNSARVDLICGDAEALRPFKNVDVFLANINRNIILADLEKYVATISPSAVLLLSGFYLADVPVIEEALRNCGMKIAETVTEADNWTSVKAVFAN